MDLEFATLFWCKTPHLELLARRLGVSLPAPGSSYHRHLAERVAHGIEHDKRRAAAEERRMAEATRVADEIAVALGETGERPKAQIRRIVGLMGAQWTSDACEAAACLVAGMGPDTLGLLRLPDGTKRTFGGVFFAWCRQEATAAVKAKSITRRDFFRCFTDRPKRPRPPKERPPVKAWKPIAPPLSPTTPRSQVAPEAWMNGNHEVDPPGVVQHRTRGGKGPVGRLHDKRSKAPVPVEVYVSPRRRA